MNIKNQLKEAMDAQRIYRSRDMHPLYSRERQQRNYSHAIESNLYHPPPQRGM